MTAYPCRFEDDNGEGDCYEPSKFFAIGNIAQYGHLCEKHYELLPTPERAYYWQKSNESKKMTSLQKAIALVKSIDDAIKAGTKHFNRAGVELLTVSEVLCCIRDEKEVTLVQTVGEPRGTGTTNYDLPNLGGDIIKENPSLAAKVEPPNT